METLILIVAFVIEIAFAIYCIITKSNQEKVSSYIRIGALVAFLVLTLTSLIHWSFLWFGLALLLFIWAVLGVWTLIRKKNDRNIYKAGSILRRAMVGLLLVVIVMVPNLIFPQHQQPKMTGKHPVATANFTYTDRNRIESFSTTGENREVNVEFWYPRDGGGPYPLVVFDHGILGLKASNTSTFMELASNGYIVCSIDHPYLSLFTVDSTGHRTIINNAYLQEYLDVSNGKYDEQAVFTLEHKWMQLRIADINFVLDTIMAQTHAAGPATVYQLIDPKKIGLMGHSLGGESSAQVARLRNDIHAVVNLDADLAGEYVDFVNGRQVLNEKVYPVPILSILSDTLERLISAVPDANGVIAVKRVTATAPNAFEVHLAGTDHMSLTDLPLISPFLVSMINASVPKAGGHEVDPLSTINKMNELVLEFFNVYLKGAGKFSAAGTY
jgi:dienelactone hydrolase